MAKKNLKLKTVYEVAEQMISRFHRYDALIYREAERPYQLVGHYVVKDKGNIFRYDVPFMPPGLIRQAMVKQDLFELLDAQNILQHDLIDHGEKQ
jgi:hypothetical protein